jgi:hypothetical protein
MEKMSPISLDSDNESFEFDSEYIPAQISEISKLTCKRTDKNQRRSAIRIEGDIIQAAIKEQDDILHELSKLSGKRTRERRFGLILSEKVSTH